MENVYAPPLAAVADLPSAGTGEFYVVGQTKLMLLFVGTLSLYSVYYWYQQWARYGRFNKQSLWPVPRAIFQVFFTHAFTSEVEHRLHRRGQQLDWSPKGLATAYVLLLIATNLADRVSGLAPELWWVSVVGIGLLPILAWTLARIQRAVNVAAGDPTGESNRRLTWANVIWLVVGGLMWLLVIAGVFLTLNGDI